MVTGFSNSCPLVSVSFHQSCPSFNGMRSIDNTLRQVLLSKEYFLWSSLQPIRQMFCLSPILLMRIWCQFFPSWIPFDWQFSRPAPLLFLSGVSRPIRTHRMQVERFPWAFQAGAPSPLACLPLAPPILSCAHYYQAPGTRATMLPLKFPRDWCFLEFLWRGSLNLS